MVSEISFLTRLYWQSGSPSKDQSSCPIIHTVTHDITETLIQCRGWDHSSMSNFKKRLSCGILLLIKLIRIIDIFPSNTMSPLNIAINHPPEVLCHLWLTESTKVRSYSLVSIINSIPFPKMTFLSPESVPHCLGLNQKGFFCFNFKASIVSVKLGI